MISSNNANMKQAIDVLTWTLIITAWCGGLLVLNLVMSVWLSIETLSFLTSF